MVTPVTAVGIFFSNAITPLTGGFNVAFGRLGLGNSHNWLFDSHLAIFVLAGVWIWIEAGFVFVICLSAMRAVPLDSTRPLGSMGRRPSQLPEHHHTTDLAGGGRGLPAAACLHVQWVRLDLVDTDERSRERHGDASGGDISAGISQWCLRVRQRYWGRRRVCLGDNNAVGPSLHSFTDRRMTSSSTGVAQRDRLLVGS